MTIPINRYAAVMRCSSSTGWRILLSAILLVMAALPARSQYSAETFNLKKASEQYDERGFQKGQVINVDGKMAVSNANGGVSYSYTLDKFSQKGYGFQVSLNYCNSVAFSSFKNYNHGTAAIILVQGQEVPVDNVEGPDYWDKFTRNHPLWIIGLNGFAVQTLSLASDYLPPVWKNDTVWSSSQIPWVIEGYDFCNRMNRMENAGQYDVISLLRADGSLLQLRNPYIWGEGTIRENHEYVTGRYFEDDMNSTGFAVVEYDTTYIMTGMLDTVRQSVNYGVQNGLPNYWKNQWYKYLPRRVKYYPGDGLEYVFLEQQAAYGWQRYGQDNPAFSGGKTAGPTIFYLREINDASGVVMNLTYSRHMQQGEATPGRALLKDIGDYVHVNYGSQAIVVEAHSRTTSLQLEKAIPLELFEVTGGNELDSKSYIGMIKKLRDPENRLTEFGYENYNRFYINYKHPYPVASRLAVKSSRLTSIKEPTAQYSISYYEGSTDGSREIVYVSGQTPSNALANWRLNNAARVVTKYNTNHQWLSTETYCYDGMDLSLSPCQQQVIGNTAQTIYTLKDRRTQQEKTITYTFQKHEVSRYANRSEPHPLAVPLVFTAPIGVTEEADGKTVSTYTSYVQQSGGALYMPVSTEQQVRDVGATGFTAISKVNMEYTLQPDYSYGGPTAVADKHLLKVQKKTEIQRNPEDETVLLKNVTEYLHLPYISTPQQVTQVVWDKIASQKKHRALVDAQQLFCTWEDMPDSLQVYDTLGVRDFTAPPFYGLVKEQYRLDDQNNYLGGTKTTYEETSRAPGQNWRGLPLRDSLIAENRASSTLISETTYGSSVFNNGNYGWKYSDERYPVRVRDGNGAVKEQEYRFPRNSITSGLRLNDDGTTHQQELRDRIQSLGIEKPLISRSLVRNARTGATDILQGRNEWTVYGLLSGQSDLNGYYSRFEYDNNGRLKQAQLPKDFLGTDTICTERFDGKKEYVTPVYWTRREVEEVTVRCPGDHRTYRSFMDTTYMALSAGLFYAGSPCGFREVTTGLAAPTTGDDSADGNGADETTRSGKRGREEVLTTITNIDFGGTTTTYNSVLKEVAVCKFDTTDQLYNPNLFAAAQTLRGGSFRFFISSMTGRCIAMQVNVIRESDRTVLAKRNYVLNCAIGGLTSSINGGGSGKQDAVLSGSGEEDYQFDVKFNTTELQAFALCGLPGLVVEVSVTTPGAGIVLVADAEDKRPRWVLDGVFNLPKEQQQFTVAYEYSRITDTDVIQRVKTEDKYTAVNYPTSSCRPMHYTEVRNSFGANHLVEKTKLFIGDPTNPVRIDSIVASHTGFGLTSTTTDQEGYVVTTEYDTWGRPIKVTNADNTYTTITYTGGRTSDLTWLDQDFYGYYNLTLTEVYDPAGPNYPDAARRMSQYYDAFGRLRVEGALTGSDTLRTKYEYDNQNRLLSVVNPAEDTTHYWYDSYGRIKYKYQPDMGYTSYGYDALGQVRFTQTQQQADSLQLTFMEYDDLGRVTLVGEARISGEGVPGGGGGHALLGNQKGGKKEQVLFPPHPSVNLNRLTDILDAKVLHDAGASLSVTANRSVWLPVTGTIPQFWALNQLDQTTCIPQPMQPQMSSPFLLHPVQNYSDPGLPTAAQNAFENITTYPQNARVSVYYDALPVAQGSVWQYFPTAAQWNALAPTGTVRNLKGREVAVAYRGHAGEPYHFVVMSYDERGRVEALLRYTENLGFDAVYYTYNGMNAITSMRAVDPLRQSSTWYGYDWNGRVDSVWSKLGDAGTGLGVTTPAYVAAETRPVQPDIVYSYSKRGAVESMKYPQIATEVKYRYNARAFLDSLVAEKSGASVFYQLLTYDVLGNILRQTSQHAGQSVQYQDYTYDLLQGFLSSWIPSGQGSTQYEYDRVGNRTTNFTLSTQNNYEYGNSAHPNQLTRRRDWAFQSGNWTETGYTDYVYNASGAMTSRTVMNGTTTVSSEVFGYDNIQGVVKKYVRTQGPSVDDWRYRYTASGEREQKRLYSTTQQPVKEWTYYLLDGAKRQLAVYEGIESNQTSCGLTLGNFAYLSASEYLYYGGGSTHSFTIKPINATSSRKEYKVQDMLGSTRVAIEPNGSGGGVITGQYDYEPFGKVMWKNGLEKRLSWIDKEKDEESGDHNFGVRQYDDVSGRFMAIDPLWEKYRSLSPYQYSNNNPLILKDPSGKTFGGGPVTEAPAQEGRESSGSLTTRKARSADDPPRGSSHVEESFKEAVKNTAALPGIIARKLVEMNREVMAAEIAKDQAITPDYIQLSICGTEILGTGGTAASNFTLLNTGGHQEELVRSSTTGPGLGYDVGFSIAFTMGWFVPSDGNLLDNSGVTVESLAGKGYNWSVGGAYLGSFGLTGGIAPTSGGQYNSIGITFGKSLPGPVSASFTITDTEIIK